MSFINLGLNRFGFKDANQSDQTKDSVYTSANPTPKQIDEWRKMGQGNRSNEEDRGAPNVLTGTVITSCFIQTSALPSRVEIAGNDITFYDDTFTRNGEVIGDTSRIVWTHDLNSDEGFIMEKRSSTLDTYDNVFSFYARPAKAGRLNYMYFGRDGEGNIQETNYINFNVNHTTGTTTQESADGSFIVTGSLDGVKDITNIGIAYFNEATNGGSAANWSVYLSGFGPAGTINVNSTILPLHGGINIGDPGAKFGTFYGSVSACPLPTVENALEMLKKIPDPVDVGERGHYGLDKIYFDDLTMPEELLHTDSKGHVDIEHNHMLGFLLKVVKELQGEVETLKEENRLIRNKVGSII